MSRPAALKIGDRTIWRVEVTQERIATFWVLSETEDEANDAAKAMSDDLYPHDWDYDTVYASAHAAPEPSRGFEIVDVDGNCMSYERWLRWQDEQDDPIKIHPNQGTLL